MKSQRKFKRIILKGKTAVFVDWANVYGWTKSLGKEPNHKKIFEYLKSYAEIADIRLYFGKNIHPKSEEFLAKAEKIGYAVVSKPVRYVAVSIDGKETKFRKCDFDMEVCIDTHQKLAENFTSFVFFTGDGDYEPLYKLLIERGKQVIVVYTKGHLGREIWNIKRGLFKAQLKNIMEI